MSKNPRAHLLRPLLLALAFSAPLMLALAPEAAHALPAARAGLPSTNVAWIPVASDAEVDAALARAKAERKPVMLYWGASWCPPCNALKATLFKRDDFAQLARRFVAVHVDGDRPGAQKVGTRFGVSAYPTVLLLSASGQELARLPGEAEPEQVLALMRSGLAGGRPIQALVADARAGKALDADAWRVLAWHSWELDAERSGVRSAELPELMADLARRAPASEPELVTRLWLQAAALSDDGKGLKADAALRERFQKLYADAAATRAHAGALAYQTPHLVRWLAPEPGAERAAWVQRADAAMQRLAADATVSRSDRAAALDARIGLARIDEPEATLRPKMPEPLLRTLRETVATMDREITDGYERQAVITALGGTLADAGLFDESDALLRGNLARSHSPYYLMSQLASNARKLGRADEALRWSRQAWERSEGPATRLQWGSGYLNQLVALAPQDAKTIEATAGALLKEAATDPAAFHERSARSLQRVGSRIKEWAAKDAGRAPVVQRLRAQTDALCKTRSTADGQRAACQKVFG